MNYQYIIIALLLANLLLQIYNMRPFREGFQVPAGGSTNPQFTLNPSANPNTCTIILAVREQLVKSQQAAAATGTEADVERIKVSIATIDKNARENNCKI